MTFGTAFFVYCIPENQNTWYDSILKHLKLNVKGAKLSQIYEN